MDFLIAKNEEIDEIYQLINLVFTPFLEKYRDDDVNPAKMTKGRLFEKMNDEFSDFYVLKENQIIIGLVRLVHVTWDFAGQDKYHISLVGIHPDYQNQGRAQEMFQYIERKHHPKDGFELVTILQEERNIHLYEKLGYSKVGELIHHNSLQDFVTLVKK
ncbi:MAG: GNAT family N-acetyltransferase [Lactococcus sp.]